MRRQTPPCHGGVGNSGPAAEVEPGVNRILVPFLYGALALLILETVAVVAVAVAVAPWLGDGLSWLPLVLTVGAVAWLNVRAIRAVSRMGTAGERLRRRRLALAGAALVQLALIAFGVRHGNTPLTVGPVLVLVAVAPLASRACP
ncbi:hypothetical protein VM98_29935 [Streptomyces rubellomurinus subsp. indigoferus]|nr:hypothetical protein VM98_29935 [Streptomyces rubellomurinus subsp. indigoferus]